ncbi:hypothetical protein [Alteromonas sp. ASW11-130]|uniref:hypothetical protein n=1 Tax=Alteromonas sp. ASW11-130 TaxID=3015775 RepID=UPI002241A35A|nr:hypothetical protein [Alteromonas sp. ASW11-130]MCW8092626.1 hypothetical protein [Alteromonas sp. ASW11-130]
MNNKIFSRISCRRLILLIVTAFVVLQTAVFGGQIIGALALHHQANDRVYERILLDSFYLDVGNDALSTSVNEQDLRSYIHSLNADLREQRLPVRVLSIQDVHNTYDFNADYSHPIIKSFTSSEQHVTIHLANLPLLTYLHFNLPSLVVSIFLGLALYRTKRSEKSTSPSKRAPKPLTPILIVNLEEKTLINNIDNKVVNLQNKPFCFYAALLQYCINHPNSTLSHQQDIPNELSALCNRVFSRLIELGHTKRKRPDFNANLDKTLSEIRSALDELYIGQPTLKEKYYPPRAQGEGSRSKQHSFALRNLKASDIEITHT